MNKESTKKITHVHLEKMAYIYNYVIVVCSICEGRRLENELKKFDLDGDGFYDRGRCRLGWFCVQQNQRRSRPH